VLRSFLQSFNLLLLIIRYGRFKHIGRNFNRERKEALQELRDFYPQPKRRIELPLPPLVHKSPLFRRLVSEAAFVKRNLMPHGGHLHTSFYNLAYIRIPKSASTSLSYAMLCSIYPELRNRQLSSTTINYLADVNVKDYVADDNAIFFTVVRNPFARMVSVYRDFYEQPSAQFIYEDYLFGILPRKISFHEFVKRVAQIPDVLLDQHLKSQHMFLDYYRKRVLNLIVLKLEKPMELEAFLSIYNLSIHQLNKSPEPYDYTTYYDRTTLEKVYAIYERDVQLLQYESEYQQLRKALNTKSGDLDLAS
jgi:hypothetical protein